MKLRVLHKIKKMKKLLTNSIKMERIMRFLLTLFSLAFITGCVKQAPTLQHENATKTHRHSVLHTKKTLHEQDGAPAKPKPFFFQALKPKHEPMSRYGNPDSYVVDGRVYEVMTSASGYKARGTASWYGTKFDKHRTSSGEKYDMYAMTAAHRTLPIPSYIRVKNLQNGRVAVVRVNDRGPFHSKRVVDLSYAAAHYLGLLPKGTAQVEVESLTSTSHSKTHAAHYYIQAGAFQSNQLARSLQLKVKRLTKAHVAIEKYQKKFIVKVGPFNNKQQTNNIKQQLAKRGIGGTFTFIQ
jgi:rare lipoprotein A